MFTRFVKAAAVNEASNPVSGNDGVKPIFRNNTEGRDELAEKNADD